jgi:hypothetical protein
MKKMHVQALTSTSEAFSLSPVVSLQHNKHFHLIVSFNHYDTSQRASIIIPVLVKGKLKLGCLNFYRVSRINV